MANMIRWLVTVFSVMFALNAGFSALWLTVDHRSSIAGCAAHAVDAPVISGLEVRLASNELLHTAADHDTATEHLMVVESSDAHDGTSHQLPVVAVMQMRVSSESQWVAPILPWTYLKGHMRPPIQQA